MAWRRSKIAPRSFRTLFHWGSSAAQTDGQLLERFTTRVGEPAEQAFAMIVERHSPMVFRTCRAILRDDHEALDASQATFLVLAQKGQTLWLEDSLGPWLHRVACRVSIRAKVVRKRRQEAERKAGELLGEATYRETRDDLRAVVQEEVDGLPEHYRVPIVLCCLEGRTYEEVARHLGWPVGTVKSRLNRGRQRLQGRLVRRGLAPASGALVELSASNANSAESIVAQVIAGVKDARSGLSAGVSSATAAQLARDCLRSMIMAKFRKVAVILAVSGGVSVAVDGAFRPAAGFQAPLNADTPKHAGENAQPAPEPEKRADLEERHRDLLMATVGNFRPLIKNNAGQTSFQSRWAEVYKDGKVKLWFSLQSADPVCPALEHKTPIREAAFIDSAAILITVSDDTTKIWDGLSGTLKKELVGQVVRPLFFTQMSGSPRFATIDNEGKVVTTWDVATLEPLDTLRWDGPSRLLGAGLSTNGKWLATIAEDQSVTLWATAAKKPFATLRLPSRLVARVFVDEPVLPKKTTLQLDNPFWQGVQTFAPSED